MAKKKPDGPKRKKRPLPSIEVEGFGKLVYWHRGGHWTGRVALPTLAAKIKSEGGGKDSAGLGWWRMPAGSFALSVKDERRQGPAPQQVAALRLLAGKQAKVCREVLRCHTATQKEAKRGWEEQWRETFAQLGLEYQPDDRPPRPKCTLVEVLDLQYKGVAYIDFDFDDDIDPEHGSHIVYHPEAGTRWTSSVYETRFKGTAIYKRPEPSIHDQLVYALIDDDKREAERLLAAGADVNGFSREVGPPLYSAVASGDVKLLRQLLEMGADPNRRGGETRSVLSEAKAMLRDLEPWAEGPGPTDSVGRHLRVLAVSPAPALEDLVPGDENAVLRSLRDEAARHQEIVRLLVATGAR